MKSGTIFFFLITILLGSCVQEKSEIINYREKDLSPSAFDVLYESGNWNHPDYSKAFESNGNHRVVIEVNHPSDSLTQVFIPWRRRDANPQEKDIVIVDAKTNIPIEQKQVLEITNEFGHLIFKPNPQSLRYYIYFLPHSSTGSYYPKLQYKKPIHSKENPWFQPIASDVQKINELPKAIIISMQSIDDFNSFYPMEIIATKAEVSAYTELLQAPYYLFPEYREHPIKMQDYLAFHWVIKTKKINGLSDQVDLGEYFTFQIGVYSEKEKLQDLKIKFSDLEHKSGHKISKNELSCFNKGGLDLNGDPFEKQIDVLMGKVQALWFGIQIPETAKPGNYLGKIIVQPTGLSADTVFLNLDVSSEIIANFGDDEPEKMSRLRWLNSTIGTNEKTIIKPFEPVQIANKTLHILGRDIELNELGLPQRISSYFSQEMTTLKQNPEEVLAEPMRFEVFKRDGSRIQWKSIPFTIHQDNTSAAHWNSSNESTDIQMSISGNLEYDGMLDYQIELIAKKDIDLENIKLQIPLQKEAATYMLGLGRKGAKLDQDIKWKWDITRHQEGAWLGDVNKGIQFVLRDNNYERPLNTNFYQAKPLNLPPSWFNDHHGGINITRDADIVSVDNYSGARKMIKGDTLLFNIRFLITPFKLINTKEHFNTRFVHKYIPVDSVASLQGTIVNVHHANEINPYINYPFYNIEKQKIYIDEAHSKGIKVKLYNTIRELSYKSHELFALRSLGHEILNDGEGGGHSWLQEHLKSNYHSAWHATRVNDAAILNKGTSRWTNYYIEGINWLAKNQKIDGLYLDDIAFSRTTVKRIASVFSKQRDSFVIDLHSANQYNHRDGFINSAFLYMEHFPFITRLWFGEYFEYDLDPDYWLTEVSGIPFGLTGEMLEKGGHPYRGMVYGMTTRVYGNYNPGALWKLFNDFGIAESEMLGYWVDRSPIKTNHSNIKSCIYLNGDKVLITIGSWSDKDESVELIMDWEALGFSRTEAHLTSPEIEGLQSYAIFDVDKPITIERNNGLILILKKNK